MKKLSTLLLILNSAFCILNSAFAQAPQAIPYQAVARDLSGNPIPNKNISLRFSIHDSIPGGAVVYKETQSATTNLLGLFTSNIGQGTIVSGTFAAINWAKSFKYLQVELDTAGGSNYTNMGTEQMLSVPYAFYSRSSSGGWGLSGNAGTVDTANFIGTTDNVPFNIRVNNQKAGRIDPGLGLSGIDLSFNFHNSFFGAGSGSTNTSYYNSFFGAYSGYTNSSGNSNSFLGALSGALNTSGGNNSFFGKSSGYSNTTGLANSFFGKDAGFNNTIGSNNSFFGANARAVSDTVTNSTAIGANARADASNTLILGSVAGMNGATSGVNVGIGTASPLDKLHVVGNVRVAGGIYASGNALVDGDVTVGNFQVDGNVNINSEVNRPSTGSANLVPIAYGNISSQGIIMSGTGNFTALTVGGSQYYTEITINGYNYDDDDYITIITPSLSEPLVPTTSSFNHKLIIYFTNTSTGFYQASHFHFVIFKP